MNEVKVGKLPIIIAASYTCNLVSKLLQGGREGDMVAFCSIYTNSTDFCV